MPINTLKSLLDHLEARTPTQVRFLLHERFEPVVSKARYLADIARIKAYISAGDCYQVNYAHCFKARFSGDSYGAFLHLRDVAPGDFSAFLRINNDHAVLSLSPERFLSVDDGRVTTQPIKGTRARDSDPVRDKHIALELQFCPKDRSENVMITDLLRNDLGRFCRAGSVITSELCALRHYDNVHHLVSTVQGELREDVTSGQLLIGCSPGGSITGAPKIRAMQIIHELESGSRGAYCGSVFALWPDGKLQSSIAIRTFEAVDEQLICWAGGGIVYDSSPEAEYQETLDKVGHFLRRLETTERQ